MMGTDGQPQGPSPHVHILPCPYYTRPWRTDSPYSRGERGEDVGGGPLWSPVRCPFYTHSLFAMYCPKDRPYHFKTLFMYVSPATPRIIPCRVRRY